MGFLTLAGVLAWRLVMGYDYAWLSRLEQIGGGYVLQTLTIAPCNLMDYALYVVC